MPDIDCITPIWSAPPVIKVFSTTRSGGVSQPPYDRMNLGLHVADDPLAVAANRQTLARALDLPAPPRWLKQVHGRDVISIDGPANDDGSLSADGSVTARTDRVAVVLTADCLPVVVTDAVGSQVAVVHAGWRGLAAGILHSALQRFPAHATLHAWLGPAIGPQAFEVGAEVRDAFTARDEAHANAFIKRERVAHAPASGAIVDHSADKYLANIYQLARRELDIGQRSRGGSIETTGGEHCTFTESARFHSHRRDGIHSGRMATLAWIAAG